MLDRERVQAMVPVTKCLNGGPKDDAHLWFMLKMICSSQSLSQLFIGPVGRLAMATLKVENSGKEAVHM